MKLRLVVSYVCTSKFQPCFGPSTNLQTSLQVPVNGLSHLVENGLVEIDGYIVITRARRQIHDYSLIPEGLKHGTRRNTAQNLNLILVRFV